MMLYITYRYLYIGTFEHTNSLLYYTYNKNHKCVTNFPTKKVCFLLQAYQSNIYLYFILWNFRVL